MADYQNEDGSRMERAIRENGRIVSVPIGKSMWPMLKNRKNHIVITAVTRPLRRYDVPMYRRPGGSFVLHRIIKVQKDGGYVICGDNLWRKEYNVRDEDIVGVLAGFFKGKRYIDCETNHLYHAYVLVWRFLYPFRSCLLLSKGCFAKVKRNITRRRK
ncbi:MAG: hypothetical protein HFH14_11160 [Lachnospiraceae bacterium]|nr:hypothetical protein [Lachnospiraceae bacterium]